MGGKDFLILVEKGYLLSRKIVGLSFSTGIHG